MRLVSFALPSSPGARLGALVGADSVLDLSGAVPASPLLPAWERFDLDGPWLPKVMAAAAAGAGQSHALASVQLLAPVARPGKIICIGLNYRDHAAESNMPIPKAPVTFSKFSTCVVGPGATIELPPASQQVDYEAELAVVIGRRARGVSREAAFDCVLGYTNFNDVSARDFQFADGQWQRGKSCDTFAPMGPAIVTRDEVADPHALRIQLRLNGQTMQDSTTAQLIFGIDEVIAFLSQSITLEPGDVIATGTPPGVGFARKPPVFMQAGDTVEVEVEGLGVLANRVAAAAVTTVAG